jgi:hypothetical protein
MSKRKKWRCFHCDEVFIDRRAAWEHFGDDYLCSSDVPACVDPLRTDEKLRAKELRDAREHAMKMQRESEAADDKVALLDQWERELLHYFGHDVRSPHQAWLKLEHWQNLDQANRERIQLLERLMGEAHEVIAGIAWEAKAPPTRWMLEAEKYCETYG